MSFDYLGRTILGDDDDVNYCLVFHYLVNMNEFLDFMNVLFENC